MSSLLRSNAVVATGTALSRVTGLLRVAVLGIVVGQTPLAEAYNQANASPNLIYELLLGGILSASLVPLFTRLSHDNDRDGIAAVVTVSAVVMAVITAIAVVLGPLIFRLYASFTSDAIDGDLYREVGGVLARVFLVQIFFYGLNAIASAYLNSQRRFFAAAWAPVLANVMIIASFLIVDRATDAPPVLEDVLDNSTLFWALGLGATLGIAVMAIALIPALVAAKMPFRFNFDMKNPAVQQLRTLSGWALGYVVANQIAIIVIQNLTEPGSGNQDAYTKAFTFFVLPHGLLAMSIATTFLPEMSTAIKERDKPKLIDRSELGIRLVALLTIPAGFGLFVLRRPIIGLAFEHGNFSPEAALTTSRALAGLALGLGGFSIYLFVLRAFYAHQDARTPFVINVVENLLNIVLAIVLVDRYGVLGLGLALAIAYIVSALWALQVLSYKVPGYPLRSLLASLGRIVLASVVMAEVVWLVARSVGGNSGLDALVRVGAGTVAGIAVYVGLLLALGSDEVAAIRRRFVRSNP